mgnify:CR=1 FL=1
MEHTTQTIRILDMEKRLNRAQEAVTRMAEALEQFKAIKKDIQLLSQYLSSKEWKHDFADSEEGNLPPDLPQGVLSEDGIWNVLEDYRELMRNMQQFSGN